MAGKKIGKRLFCIDNRLVLLNEGEIETDIKVDEEELKEELLKQIKQIGRKSSTARIFAKAIEEVTSYQFAVLSYKYKKKAIHDSTFYIYFQKFIIQESKRQQGEQKYVERKEAKKEYISSQRPYFEHQSEIYNKKIIISARKRQIRRNTKRS